MKPAISRALVEQLLLGPTGDRRQLQDSPILGDVWIAFAENPAKPQELLITPHGAISAGEVAEAVDERVAKDRNSRSPHKAKRGTAKPDADEPLISYLQGVVAAQLFFHDVLRVLIPLSGWWQRNSNRGFAMYRGESFAKQLEAVLDSAIAILAGKTTGATSGDAKNGSVDPVRMSAVDRYVAMAGIILWAATEKQTYDKTDDLARALDEAKPLICQLLVNEFKDSISTESPPSPGPLIHQISMNRRVQQAVSRSVPAVKADAARTLFTVNCSKIAWAVIDSGIQGDHPAFCPAITSGRNVDEAKPSKTRYSHGPSRVQAAFDFSSIREIVNTDNLRLFATGTTAKKKTKIGTLISKDLKNTPTAKQAEEYLVQLASDLKMRRPLHWECVWPFIEIRPETRPVAGDHGTHVAGILGASREAINYLPEDEWGEYADGMCPDIKLYDFRVLSDTATNTKDTEFAVIAALQFIRYLNDRKEYVTIHGANLSLSIPHDVRNYACGRTPVCVECERLVDSGVVVVAAAGNFGYQRFETNDGIFDGYTAFSVTDPGNADGVITVGATHRYSPHTYGVSFFSSRGPTGDGRLKPDLVAPGERISGPFREGWGDLDGTSMAAPHVSGAAAMLMARYSELVGRPRRIKQVLCDSATDLGRERSFQGRGMLDILRALQSI